MTCARATLGCCPPAALLPHTTQRRRSRASTPLSKAVVLEASEISCSYWKPAGRPSNSWGCRGKNCKGTWSGLNVSSIDAGRVGNRGQIFG